jgi:hypothetical protein
MSADAEAVTQLADSLAARNAAPEAAPTIKRLEGADGCALVLPDQPHALPAQSADYLVAPKRSCERQAEG